MTMRLDEMRLRNFRPFYGEYSLRFGRSRPMTVVHAANGRGKTSLLYGVRWALYGQVLDRTGRVLPRIRLVNRDAASGGDWTMSAELSFEVDAITYELTRAIQPRNNAISPRTDADFEERLFLKRAGHFFSEAEAQREINRILPEQISRFFLFDGELLNEYEQLVADQPQHSRLLQDSIEHILGVPALQNGIADLRGNLKDAQRRQASLALQDKRTEVLAAQVQSLTAEIDQIDADLTRLRDEQKHRLAEQYELDQALKEVAGIEANVRLLQDYNSQIDRLKQQREQLQADKRTKLAQVWRDFIQPRVARRLQQVESERDQQFNVLKQSVELETQLREIDHMLAAGTCPVCSHEVDASEFGSLTSKREELVRALEELHFDEQRVQQVGEEIRKLRQVTAAGVMDAIAILERGLLQNTVDLSDLELKRDELEDDLGNVDQTAVIRNRRRFQQVTEELGLLRQRITEKEVELEQKRTAANNTRAQMSRVSGASLARLNREVEIYQELASLFERAKERLRDDLRDSIERDANDIFRQISTDPTYSLCINDHYGLRMMDANGQEVQDRSAGFEQVVALALIGALNRNAVRRGPILMDTPFGRLDPGHRESILRYLPQMAEQVGLLVHGGEIDRERDLEAITDMIDREYVIEQLSHTRSQLRVLNGG